MEDIEINLNNCLASMTILFNADRYSSIYTAYKLLGKIEVMNMSRYFNMWSFFSLRRMSQVFLEGLWGFSAIKKIKTRKKFFRVMYSRWHWNSSDYYFFLFFHINFHLFGFFKECAMKVVGFTHATLESSARTVIIDKILPIKAGVEEFSYEQLCEVCLDSVDGNTFPVI